MQYVFTKTADPAIAHAVKTLSSRLRSGEKVAWFLSGGSAIELEVRIAQALQAHDVSRLTVGLIDERYGPPGHKDENYLKIMDAHFPFYIHRVLTGAPPEEAAEAFGATTSKLLGEADFSLGILGIGADGHTAGIKPGSPSVTSTEPAVFYDWDDFRRITLTPPIIREFDEAIIYATGSDKASTLRSLLHSTAPIKDQPAQILKDIEASTLYTDNRLV